MMISFHGDLKGLKILNSTLEHQDWYMRRIAANIDDNMQK